MRIERPLVIVGIFAMAGILFCILVAGMRPSVPPLSLTLRLEQRLRPTDALEFTVALQNISTRTQMVTLPSTNFFWGRVHLRGTNGETHEFFHTNILGWVISAMVIQKIYLAPGTSFLWRHRLTDFVDFLTNAASATGGVQLAPYRILATDFQQGCELWCRFDITTNLSISTRTVGYPQPKSPNKIGRANHRPASPFNAGRQFDGASCAPPCLSAAVAHLYRSAPDVGTFLIVSLLLLTHCLAHAGGPLITLEEKVSKCTVIARVSVRKIVPPVSLHPLDSGVCSATVLEALKGSTNLQELEFRFHAYGELSRGYLPNMIGKDYLVFLHEPPGSTKVPRQYRVFQGEKGMKPIVNKYAELRLVGDKVIPRVYDRSNYVAEILSLVDLERKSTKEIP